MNSNDLKTVNECTYPARSKWYDIGIKLDIDVGTLEAINKDNLGKCGDCFRELLITWLRRDEPVPSWKTLTDALQSQTVGINVLEVCSSKHIG